MLISNIHIKNFRCLSDVSLTIDDFTALLGRNGAGKSTVLRALEIFYDLTFRPDAEDFCNRKTEHPIEIILTYHSLSPKELKMFSKHVKDDTITVKKVIALDSTGNYFSYSSQVPEFAEARKATKATDKKATFNSIVSSAKYPELTAKATTGPMCDQLMDDFEKQHSEYCQPTEGPFLGTAHVGGGSLDNFTKFVFIPAIKEASGELIEKKSSVIGRLLDVVVMRQINRRADVIKFKEDFEKRANDIFNADNLPELEEAGKDIDKILKSFAPESGFSMRWGAPTVPDVPPPPTIVNLIEDGFEGDVSRKGHGLQRALIFSLLQYEASIKAIEEQENSKQDEKDNTEDNDDKIMIDTPNLILAIEEPELYQHHQRCRALAQILADLTGQKRQKTTNQIIIATHSPLFINLDKYHHIRLLKRNNAIEPDGHKPVSVGHYSLEQLTSDLQSVAQNTSKTFTARSTKARSMPIMDVLSNEGFFADAVLVVEGFGDAGMLWALQDLLKKNWPAKGISIIPAKGKNNIDRHVLIFRGFGLPVYYLFDGDKKNEGCQGEANTKKSNCLLLRLGGEAEVDFPATQVSDSFTCFEYDIETYIKAEIGDKPFSRIANEVANDLGYDSVKKALKNIDAGDELVRRIYSEELRLLVLEQLVRKVTALVGG